MLLQWNLHDVKGIIKKQFKIDTLRNVHLCIFSNQFILLAKDMDALGARWEYPLDETPVDPRPLRDFIYLFIYLQQLYPGQGGCMSVVNPVSTGHKVN